MEKIEYQCEFCGRKFIGRNIGYHIQPKSKGKCRSLYKEKYGNDGWHIKN